MDYRPVRRRRLLPGEMTLYSLRVTPEERKQMQAIADHRRWPEAEAWRDAVRVYLGENRDLLRLLGAEQKVGSDG